MEKPARSICTPNGTARTGSFLYWLILRYPPGDKSLIPLREQVYDWLLSKQHLEYVRGHEAYAGPVFKVRGLTRAHASMEGNAVYYLNALGLADDNTTTLADRLVDWQWPDGGWNCDKSPSAHTSSFTESLLPLRGLSFHSTSSGGPTYQKAVRKAAEFFLERKTVQTQARRPRHI